MKITNNFTLPQPGLERSIIKSIEETTPAMTKKGRCPRVKFNFELEDGTIVPQNVLAYIGKDNLMTQIFNSIVGGIPDSPDTDMLIGKECIIEIEHRQGNKGGFFANVVACYSVDDVEEVEEIDEGIDYKAEKPAEDFFTSKESFEE